MIEQIMYFLLGATVAALVTIALLPALWRRAVRLTRARLSAMLPLTPEEIAASRDQIRAAHVVEMRRGEARIARAEADVQAIKTELGRRIAEVHGHRMTIAEREESIAALEADLADKRGLIATHEATIATLERERDNLVTNLTASRIANQALDQEAANLRTLADQRHARIGGLEVQGETLQARLGESLRTVEALRADLAGRNDALREHVRLLRDGESNLAIAQRRLAAAEGLAEDRQRTIDTLQGEKLRLIDEVGELTRARDREHIERGAVTAERDSLRLLHAETEAALAAARQTLDAREAEARAGLAAQTISADAAPDTASPSAPEPEPAPAPRPRAAARERRASRGTPGRTAGTTAPGEPA